MRGTQHRICPKTSVDQEPRQSGSTKVHLVPGPSDKPSDNATQVTAAVARRPQTVPLPLSLLIRPDATWPDEPILSATETGSGRNRGTSGYSEASSWTTTGQRDAST